MKNGTNNMNMENNYQIRSLAMIYALGTHSEAEYKFRLSEHLNITSEEVDEMIKNSQLYYSKTSFEFYENLLEQPINIIEDYSISLDVLYDFILYKKSYKYATELKDNILKIYVGEGENDVIEIEHAVEASTSVAKAVSAYVKNLITQVVYTDISTYGSIIATKYISIISCLSISNKKLIQYLSSCIQGLPITFLTLLNKHKTWDFKIIKDNFKFFMQYKISLNKQRFIEEYLIDYLIISHATQENIKELMHRNEALVKISDTLDLKFKISTEKLNKIIKHLL